MKWKALNADWLETPVATFVALAFRVMFSSQLLECFFCHQLPEVLFCSSVVWFWKHLSEKKKKRKECRWEKWSPKLRNFLENCWSLLFFFLFLFFFFFFFFFGNRCSVWGTITLLFWFCMAVILNFQSCRQLRNISSFFPFCLHFFLYKKGRFWKSVAIERVFHFSVCFHFTFISWRTFIRTLQMYVVDVCCGMLFTSYRRRLVL